MSISSMTALSAGAANYQQKVTQAAAANKTASTTSPYGNAVNLKGDLAASSLGLPSAANRAAIIRQAQDTANQAVASRATTKVADGLSQLESIAKRAASTRNDSERAALNAQFSQVQSQIDQTARNTKGVNGEKLLDGTFATTTTSTNSDGSISTTRQPNLTSNGLFGKAALNLSSADGAAKALAAVQTAQKTLRAGAQTTTVAADASTATSKPQVTGGLNDFKAQATQARDTGAQQAERRQQVLSNLTQTSRAQTSRLPNLLGLLS